MPKAKAKPLEWFESAQLGMLEAHVHLWPVASERAELLREIQSFRDDPDKWRALRERIRAKYPPQRRP